MAPVEDDAVVIKAEKDATIRQLQEELAKLRVSSTPASALTPSQPPTPAYLVAASQQSWGQATPQLPGG